MSIGFGLGLASFNFETSAGFWRWVRMCDDMGVDSIWQTDRLVSREPILECMSVMAALAGGSTRLKFGMNVASLGLRDPLLIAKQCATIDYLSGGRLLPAFGLGSNRSPDWKASGRATKARGKRMDEALAIITRLWTEEKVSFEGEFYQYEEATISPRPVQSPLPLWIGGSAPAAIERTGRYGTGWQAASESPERIGEVIAAIHQAAARHGRAIDVDHFGAGFGVRFGSWEDAPVARVAKAYEAQTQKDARQGLAVGGAEEVLAKLEPLIANGVCKFILRPIAQGDEDMIEQSRRIIEQMTPHVERLNAEWKAARA